MPDPETAPSRAFPSPVGVEGYLAWTWRLFRHTFARLAMVFIGGVALVTIVHLAVIVFLTEVVDAEGTVEGLAVSLAARIILATVAGSVLAGIASVVFVGELCGTRVSSGHGWRRLKPRFGHVVVAALYVSMPLLTLLLFLGPVVRYVLLPALLGPPVLVHAIVWEQKEFREAAVRAKNLLAGNWGRVVSTLLLLALGAALLQIMIFALAAEVLPAGGGLELPGSLLVDVLVTGPVWLFTAAASTVAYLDLRARSEELDADGLAAEAESLAATS